MQIERTRAKIVRYRRPIPFAGGGVWSSDMKATIPVYEDNNAFKDKLPPELLAKDIIDITLDDALLFAKAADRGSRDLDKMIWYKVYFDPAIRAGESLKMIGQGVPPYSSSLDAAKRLYLDVPEMIPSDILDNVVAALEQHIAARKAA